MDTYVIIPTYNESDNLPELMRQILSLPVRIGVIVVDDNSPDGTGELAEGLSNEFPEQLLVIRRHKKLGLGTAYLVGFRRAMQLGAKRVLTMDADFSHHPQYILAMIALGQEKDVVIGSRYAPGGGTLNCAPGRRALSRAANLMARVALGLHSRDVTAGFRLYRREVLDSIGLDAIFSSGYSFLVEMLYLVQEADWSVGEVPIVFEDRRAGTSKISRREIYRGIYTVARLSLRRLRRTARGILGLRPTHESGRSRTPAA